MEGESPKDYGLNHDEWRAGQREAVDFVESVGKVGIIEAPTGSGKTAIARATSRKHRVVALMKTKFLQAENYAAGYGFQPLYGRANYPCIYPLAEPGATVADCAFKESSMQACPVYEDCKYVIAKTGAQRSNRAALNYPLWLHTQWPDFEYLFCDEAHELPELVREWAGVMLDDQMTSDYRMPDIPIIVNHAASLLMRNDYVPLDRAKDYLGDCLTAMRKAVAFYAARASGDAYYRKALQKAEQLNFKIEATLSAMEISDKDWYVKSGPNVGYANGRPCWGFLCKPLTARYHFKQWFMGEYKTIMMSGTIGNFETFADELGVIDFSATRVPSVYPPASRPIYDLGVPRLGQKSKESDWQLQADRIADAIKQCDPTWHGLVHVTSKAESQRLAQRLAQRGLDDRLHVMSDRASTEKQVAEWHHIMDRSRGKGKVAIAWSLWAGYDGTREQINIVAKTPYGYLGDDYQVARQRSNGSLYLLEAAQTLVQGLGRVRRGRPQDYDGDGNRVKFVAIADGGWKWLRNYMPPDVLESVQTL